MKKNFRKFFGFAISAVLVTSVFTSCDKDENESGLNDEGSKYELPLKRVFFLNEGSYQANNAGIDFYAPNGDARDSENNFVGDIFSLQNGKALGDTGQDMIAYNGDIYVSVYGSSLLLKLNSAGVELARLEFSETDGQPRYLHACNGKIYVTLYSGKVARVDASTFKVEGYAEVGLNPEQIVQCGDNLYVINSGWGADSTISVVGINDFKTVGQIVVEPNPGKILSHDGKLYVISNGSSYEYCHLQEIDIVSGASKVIGEASAMAESNGVLYLVKSVTDWQTYVTTSTLFTYDIKASEFNYSPFVDDDAMAKISTLNVSMLEINPANGDIYIGVTDNVTNGTIIRCDKNGKFIAVIESAGISPNNAIFLECIINE